MKPILKPKHLNHQRHLNKKHCSVALVAAVFVFFISCSIGAAKVGMPFLHPESLGLHSKTISSPNPAFQIDNERFLKAITWGFEANTNLDDFLLGTNVGAQTSKYNLSLYAGWDLRPKAKQVYVEHGFNTFIKYKEGRSFLYANLEKRFGYEVGFSQVGVLIGAKIIRNFGKYRGTRTWYEGNNIILPYAFQENGKWNIIPPVIGIFWMNPDAIFKITYEQTDLQLPEQPDYTSLPFPQVSKHKIVFTFVYCFNILPKVDF